MEISRLHRIVTMVAHGRLTPGDITDITKKLVEANVPQFGKIIGVCAATSDLTKAQVEQIASLLRGPPDAPPRGPVAFVIHPERIGFAHAFAEVTKGERPVKLFQRLHDARQWVEQMQREGNPPSR